VLIVGGGASFNLAITLPVGVNPGGTFGVDANGPSLPPGMTLSSAGILSVGTAAVGTVTGISFTYTT
jgi:hypothetical protein